MGDTTTNRGYRKPLSTDDPVNLTSFWRNLADDIDADVALILKQRGIIAAPITTSSNSTATSGTTERKDDGLGDYTCTTLAGVRYRAVLTGANLDPSVAGDRFAINIRTGGASSPSASSQLWGSNSTFVAPTVDPFSTIVLPSFIPGAGTQKLAVFMKQLSGTGVATMTGAREFYVEAIGTV